jgi:preprotein translocase subunit SecA
MNQQRKTIYNLRRQVLDGKYQAASLIAEEEARKARRRGEDVELHKEEEVEREVDPAMASRIETILEHMLRRFGSTSRDEEQQQPVDAATLLPGAQEEVEVTLPEIDEIEHLDVHTLEFEAYHIFGIPTHIEKYEEDPRGALEILKQKVPQSIMAQRERLLDMCETIVGDLVHAHSLGLSENPEEWDFQSLIDAVREQFAVEIEGLEKAKSVEELEDVVFAAVEKIIEAKEEEMTPELFLRVFRHYMLQTIDRQWIEHLQNVDYLRKGIGLRGYASRDPKQEYKKEGYRMFEEMMAQIEENALKRLFRVRLAKREDALKLGHRRRRAVVEGRGGSVESRQGAKAAPTRPKDTSGRKVGRNDPCHCGSGKKYKKCCMPKDQAAAGG